MKLLGLRIGEAKPEYCDAIKPLDHVKRLHHVLKNDNASIEDRPNTQESDESLAVPDASSQKSTPTIESLRDEVEKMGSWNSGRELKFRIIELAISDIGMGKHQWHLFILCGIGWAADNLWLQGVALILPSLSVNFEVSNQLVRYATLWFYVGLSLGAAGWGVGSDIVGRRLGFNSTLVITGIFALGLANAPNFTAASIILAAVGFGVGGSLPVDGTMFLEFLPHEKRSYLTLLSIWWPVGQVMTALLAWLFVGTNFDPSLGWRFFIYSLGGITLVMALARLLFDNVESPKYLLGINKQAEAVRSVRALAHKNGTHTWLTEEILNEIGGTREITEEVKSSTMVKVRRAIASFGPETMKKISPLFGTLRLGINTALLWFIWTVIGMGYPLFNAFLPQYLSNGHETEDDANTYRNYVIISAAAIPGSILACYLVHKAGRRRPMAFATMVAGVFIFLFTLRDDSMFQLGFGCSASFFQNIMFGILYAYTPETFPGPSRGTGCGIAHSLGRLGGICAPLVAANIGTSNPSLPIYLSGGLILAGSLAMYCLRIETKHRHAS
ncbi:d5a70447-cb4b-45b6-8662-07bc91b75fd1, partial [Sclerotinia trifoliorum]